MVEKPVYLVIKQKPHYRSRNAADDYLKPHVQSAFFPCRTGLSRHDSRHFHFFHIERPELVPEYDNDSHYRPELDHDFEHIVETLRDVELHPVI